MNNFQEKVSFIWSIAELLRGPYRPEDYGDVILPMSVLRRFDAVLADTKDDVLSANEKYASLPENARDEILNRVAKQGFNNTSQYDVVKLLSDPDNIDENLRERKSTRLNSSQVAISYAVYCLRNKDCGTGKSG